MRCVAQCSGRVHLVSIPGTLLKYKDQQESNVYQLIDGYIRILLHNGIKPQVIDGSTASIRLAGHPLRRSRKLTPMST